MHDDAVPWAEITRVFDRLEPLSPAERDAGLAACEPAFAARVRALLDGADNGGILDRSLAEQADDDAIAASIPPGTRIGPFIAERLLGRGGMGEVYFARRAEQSFEQHVALKLLRVDAVPSKAMFARERRLLAKLDHPAIAGLMDGGVTDQGRPWMAMAYVDGLPIDRWCAEHAASLAERLRLFRDVCHAVGYAHANLIVHRDLKPGNIFVDQEGRIRLLDFGIAKLVDDGAVGTLAPGALMTPAYAAPEQLEGGAITVATDVHALGTILYSLLTGAAPWAGSGGNLPTVVRRMLNEEPAAPSRIAARQDGPVPARLLHGDLDAITLKALRRDPADRYPGANELANDLDRYTRRLPVLARAGSRRYRIGRYVRRNALGVAAVITILFLVAAGIAGVELQARRTAVERDVAVSEARRSDAIVQALTLMVGQAGYASDLTLKQTLDQASTRMLTTLDRSARSGAVVAAMSDLYVNMGDARGSYSLLTSALAHGIGGNDPIATANLKADLADAAMSTGAKDDIAGLLNEAERVLIADPARNGIPLQQIITTRAGLARRIGDYAGAIDLLMTNLPAAEHALAANDSALLTLYNNLLVYLIEANRLEDARPIFERAGRVLVRPGQSDAVQGLGIRQLQGVWLLRLGNAAAASQIATDVATRRSKLYGETPGLASDLAQLAGAQVAAGRIAAARISILRAQSLATRFLGPAAIPVAVDNLMVAQIEAELGNEKAARNAMALGAAVVKAMPPSSPLVPQLALTETILALHEGNKEAAHKSAEKARATFKAMGPPGAYGLQRISRLEERVARLP